MDFNARQYDAQIGRFLGIDPLASRYGQEVYSPYSAMGNAPSMMIDPNGESFDRAPMLSESSAGENPYTEMIADINSAFDRLNGGGLRGAWGNSIITDLTRGAGSGGGGGWDFSGFLGNIAMAQIMGNFNLAMNGDCVKYSYSVPLASAGGGNADEPDYGGDGCKDCPGSPFTIVDQPSTAPETSKWDLDGDGQLSVKEMTNWRENGNGSPIMVDATKIKLPSVETSGLNEGDIVYVNLLNSSGMLTQGRVYGNLELEYVGNGGFKINKNPNDYETGAENGFPWSQFPIRNTLTKIGGWIDGGKNGGVNFDIYFNGIVYPPPVIKNPNPHPDSYKSPGNW